jgi:two-component sensor histidine kinase
VLNYFTDWARPMASFKAMPKFLAILCFSSIQITYCFAQPSPKALLKQYRNSKPDQDRVRLLLQLGNFYLVKSGEEKNDLDSALLLTKQAATLSHQLNYKVGKEDAAFLESKIYVEDKNYPKVREMLKILSDSTKLKVILVMIDYKIFTKGHTKEDLDTALLYIHQASALSKIVHSEVLQTELLLLSDLCYQAQKNEQLMRSKQQFQIQQLRESKQVRNFAYILVAALLVILFIGYSRYRLKQKSNCQLQAQQEEINKQNQLLKQYLCKQEKLVEEKEWLLKEIHHRVKNNLQIVISLLNAQSEFLDHPSALHAIKESRERMQAIALIHQKLYQFDNNSMINMASYIEEMTTYLGNGFAKSGRITFQVNVDDIHLDVSQAVPLGLILNEAITNAVKYAFPNDEKGTINILLQQSYGQNILLKITDNGKGLPPDFNISNSSSLGIQLMKLFAEQLEGELSFDNINGLEISLNFKKIYDANSFINRPMIG